MNYGQLESKRKAYVPVHGSYEALEGGVVQNAFVDFIRGT
jgi:hypothetical protein